MTLLRPSSTAAALAALVMSSGCSDVLESSHPVFAVAPDASSDVPRLSSETKSDVSAACPGFTLTAMPDKKTGLTPISQTVVRGDLGVELGCWHIENPCDKPLVMRSATFTRGGISMMGQFKDRYIPKVSDVRVLDAQKNLVRFPDAPMIFPPNASWDFCVAGTVSADAVCNTPTAFSVAKAEDLDMTYDGKPITSGDFVDTNFPVVGGKTTVACGTKFIDAHLNAALYSPPSGTPIDSTVNCLSVDISSNGNYDTILSEVQIDVERQGSNSIPSAEGGLLDTSKPGEIKPNVGPIAITKTLQGDSNPVGVSLLSVNGNDDVLHFPHSLGDLEAAKLPHQTKQTFTFGLGIGNTKALIGDKVRCVFRPKPVITKIAVDGTPSDPLNPDLIGPEKDIVGPWITITGK